MRTNLPACSSGTQDHPAPAHGASPLSTERALPSATALARRRGCESLRDRGLAVYGAGAADRACARSPVGLGRAGRQSGYARGGRARRGGVADGVAARPSGPAASGSDLRGGVCVEARGGAPTWGPCLEESRPRSPDLALPFAGGGGILPSEVRPSAWCSPADLLTLAATPGAVLGRWTWLSGSLRSECPAWPFWQAGGRCR